MIPTPRQIAESILTLYGLEGTTDEYVAATIEYIAATMADAIVQAHKEGYNTAVEDAAEKVAFMGDGYNWKEFEEVIRSLTKP